LCQYHASALRNLREAYAKWTEALEISWEKYLEQVYDLDDAGIWVKEIIEYLRTEDGFGEK
jgi:hypothetical protein